MPHTHIGIRKWQWTTFQAVASSKIDQIGQASEQNLGVRWSVSLLNFAFTSWNDSP